MTKLGIPEHARREILAAATALLDGKLSALHAARRIAALSHNLDPEHRDPDLRAFVSIESQTDHLLLSDALIEWDETVREERAREVVDAEAFFRPGALEKAAAIVGRYGRPA